MKKRIRNAIARIDVMDGERSVSRGTGFLVTERLVLTALHVVANRRSEALEPYPGEIVLEFPGHRTKARIYETFFDRQSDWVLLRCSDPPSAKPIPLAYLDDSQKDWTTFGFPDANPRDGMVQTGTVENTHGDLEGVSAFQLFSKQAAAGDGAPVKGLSGAPVIVQDAVVGVLRFALMKEGRTVAGTVYACPVTALLDRASDFLAVQSIEKLLGLERVRRRNVAIWSAGIALVVCLISTVAYVSWLRPRGNEMATQPVTTSTADDHHDRGDDAGDRTTVAVLPFKRLGDEESLVFVAGMCDEIIDNLSHSQKLTVLSMASVLQYADREHLDFKQIGSELKAGSLVEGSVGQIGDRIRIHVRLCELPSGKLLWSEKFDGHLDNVWDLQDQVALMICGKLHVHLTPDEEGNLKLEPTKNVEAYLATAQDGLRGHA
jgi:TolB-like protein